MISSYSQFQRFAQCPRKWQLSKKYEPIVKAKALAEGELMHLVLGKFYAGGSWDDGKKVIEVYKAEVLKQGRKDEEVILARFDVLELVAKTYWDRVIPGDRSVFTFERIEYPFSIDIAEDVQLIGYIDGVWLHRPSGVRFIVEHKYKADHKEDLMYLDLQVSLYTLALLPEYGLLPTIYNVIRKPQNKKAKLDTPEKFMGRVKDSIDKKLAGFTWTALDMDSLFIRQQYSRGRKDLTVALDGVRQMAKRMEELKADPTRVYRNVGDHCLFMCEFRSLCLDEDPLLISRFYLEKKKKGSSRVITI